jgi:hypothetical protein
MLSRKKKKVIKKPVDNICIEINKMFSEIPIMYNKYF